MTADWEWQVHKVTQHALLESRATANRKKDEVKGEGDMNQWSQCDMERCLEVRPNGSIRHWADQTSPQEEQEVAGKFVEKRQPAIRKVSVSLHLVC